MLWELRGERVNVNCWFHVCLLFSWSTSWSPVVDLSCPSVQKDTTSHWYRSTSSKTAAQWRKSWWESSTCRLPARRNSGPSMMTVRPRHSVRSPRGRPSYLCRLKTLTLYGDICNVALASLSGATKLHSCSVVLFFYLFLCTSYTIFVINKINKCV